MGEFQPGKPSMTRTPLDEDDSCSYTNERPLFSQNGNCFSFIQRSCIPIIIACLTLWPLNSEMNDVTNGPRVELKTPCLCGEFFTLRRCHRAAF